MLSPMWWRNFAPLVDLFVNEAFVAAHRSHASIAGFTALLPSSGYGSKRYLNLRMVMAYKYIFCWPIVKMENRDRGLLRRDLY